MREQPTWPGSKHASLLALVVAVVVGVSECNGRPNIVFILADDLGWCDVSTGLTNLGNGNRLVSTPAIDRIAEEGVAFTNAYTAGPNCAPTRAALLTGRYGPHPINNVFNVGSLRRGPGDTLLVGAPQGLPSGKDGIPSAAVTYAEVLKAAGYRTAHFGKFHVVEAASAAEDIVRHHGFDENFGGNQSGAPKNYHANQGTFGERIGAELDPFAEDYTATYVAKNVRPFSHRVPEGELESLVGARKHVSDALADAAIDFMQRSSGKPFLIQFHPYAVHTPIGAKHARPDLLAKYRSKGLAGAKKKAAFAALIEGLDQSVARLVRYLKRTPDPANGGRPLAENTLLLFSSDNGGRLPQSDNGPLRGQKGELREGGIRVPLIAWSMNSDLVARGRVCHTPMTSVDLWPTFASLAEADTGKEASDGIDLSSLLIDPAMVLERDAIFWHFPGYLVGGQRNQRPQSVIRSGHWKLIYSYESQSFELFDLDADIGENNNLAQEESATMSRLSAQLLAWLDRSNAPLATLRSGRQRLRPARTLYAEGQSRSASEDVMVDAGEEMPYVDF